MTVDNRFDIQLGDILSIPMMQGAEVLAGERGLRNSIVSVNVIEVPDIVDWVRPGEFLLTTAYTFSDDIGALERMIPELKNKKVCGIGIKTHRYITEVPERVLNIANDIDFPIISIPVDVPYGDLIKAIFNKIIGEQTRTLKQIFDFNNRVRDIMLRHGGMKAIAEQIYQISRSPVVICDEVFRDSYFYCPDPKKEIQIIEDYNRLIANIFSRSPSAVPEVTGRSTRVGNTKIIRYSIPIYYDNMRYGVIYLWDTDLVIRQRNLFVIESATSLIALDILNRITLVDRENVHRSTFLEKLLSSDEKEQEKAIESADYYLFHPELASQCVVLLVQQDLPLQMTPNNSRMIKNINTNILNLTNRLKQEYDGYFLSTRKNDRAVFLLQYDKNSSDEAKREQCQRFIDILLESAKEKDLLSFTYVGVGSIAETYQDLSSSLSQAEQTVRILVSRKSDERKLFYSDLGLLRVLGHPLLREDALAYAHEVLDPLEEHDEKHRGDLIETVRVYFQCGGNLKRVAEVLFTHYNTVIYRINRIRDMYDIDLRDPETAFNFQLALKIRELLQ
ncbi:MAG: hypothetical protein GX910_01615 [Clostridiaceae bacterium]|jgi:purine catabolism regulator|nr:hypothetical protein [Clostridiaceae bacterium]